ncbi:MAG: hypothetical protein IT363_11850 [Methanoregulaceae archaeon]|nr:hypothetical protein [Methanoregulaceae archaeon]
MKRWLLLIPLALMIIACGGGGGGGIGGGGSTLTMDPAVRGAAIAKVETKQSQLLATPGLSMAERSSQMATYLRSLPEFKAAGSSSDLCAWGRFTDGGHLVVSFSRMPDWYVPGAPARDFVPSAAPSTIPKGIAGRVLHSFGNGFTDGDTATTTIKSLLGRYGYTVRPTNDGEASVQALRGVKGDSYLYYNTHGGSFEDTFVTKRFCMQSSTVRTPALDTQFDIAVDLADNTLVWMTAPNGLPGPNGTILSDTRYAITAAFVTKYWSFEQNAVAYFNVCYSAYTAAANGAQDFIAAVLAKGAAVHMGWDDSVKVNGSIFAAQYLVDRLLGANDVRAETPKQRPFMVKEILADMTAKRHIPVAGVNLVATFKAGVANAGLRPTIRNMQFLETTGVLDIYGKFGTEKGEVFVEGVPALNVQWTEDKVSCELPDTGAGSFGDVWVKVNGKESNKRQLTMYTGTFSYTETGQGSLKVVVSGTLKVRQDFAPYREQPAGPLVNPFPIPYFAAPGSTCSFTASGFYQPGQTVVERWQGSGNLTLENTPIQNPSPFWSANGAYNPATGEFVTSLIAGGPKQIIRETSQLSVMAGAFGRLSLLDTDAWTVQPFSEPGNPNWNFSAMTPQEPPTDQTEYRPDR